MDREGDVTRQREDVPSRVVGKIPADDPKRFDGL